MNLTTFERIIKNDMPFDTGFMFMYGVRVFETNHFLMAKYDIERVPYIVYNELGTIYSTKNQYFIREKTIGDLNMYEAKTRRGDSYSEAKFDLRKRNATENLIRQGLLQKVG